MQESKTLEREAFKLWLIIPQSRRPDDLKSQEDFSRKFDVSRTALLEWKKEPEFVEIIQNNTVCKEDFADLLKDTREIYGIIFAEVKKKEHGKGVKWTQLLNMSMEACKNIQKMFGLIDNNKGFNAETINVYIDNMPQKKLERVEIIDIEPKRIESPI